MTERHVTLDEMRARTAYFKDLKPYKAHLKSKVPPQVFERYAAHSVYPVMVPQNYEGRSSQAPLKGAPGLILTITESPPGDGAELHIHETTVENFFCISGRFEIFWGDEAEHRLEIGPLDICSVPPGVLRGFKNVSDQVGHLLAITHILNDRQEDRLTLDARAKANISREFGDETIDSLRELGIRFLADAHAQP